MFWWIVLFASYALVYGSMRYVGCLTRGSLPALYN
uniref:Uncharacterized protein n=1 Tax=Arundo donax TaxID=35708 RepID=A0A0A9BP55_ARUDO